MESGIDGFFVCCICRILKCYLCVENESLPVSFPLV